MVVYTISYDEESHFHSVPRRVKGESDKEKLCREWKFYFSALPDKGRFKYIRSKRRAKEVAERLNKNIVPDNAESLDENQFLLRVCSRCNNYYVINKHEFEWFKSRGLKQPRRCGACRMFLKNRCSSRNEL